MARILLFIKHRVPFLYAGIEWLNRRLFVLLHEPGLRKEARQSCDEFTLAGYAFRLLRKEDAHKLSNLLDRQGERRLKYFKPHGFSRFELSRILDDPAFLAFGAFKDEQLVGYFFLRCFWNRKCFVGRLIDREHERQGIGRVMNDILYHTAWRAGFRCYTTVSTANDQVMRSHANNPAARIVQRLPNDYLLVEFIQPDSQRSLTPLQSLFKRTFDLTGAIVGLVLTGWIIAVAWVIATIDTGQNGFFTQTRVGRYGRHFRVVKIRTMRTSDGNGTSVTTADDPRITRIGRFFRKTKIDELPQFLNVLVGDMSFVGPRPDVPGFADTLRGRDRVILSVRPGITSPATLKYRNEEQLLASVPDPEAFNRSRIFPDKVELNRQYVESWSFWQDIRYILATLGMRLS